MTHYDEFGLPPTASLEEIQRAHRSLAKLLHPDLIQDADSRRLAESQLKRLNGIYSILTDSRKRRSYDQQLTRGFQPAFFSGEQLALSGKRKAAAAWVAPVASAALALVAGFQGAQWWGGAGTASKLEAPDLPMLSAASVNHGGEEAARTGTAPPALPSAAADNRSQAPLLADTRELRRMLNQVISERDHALAKLSAVRSSPPADPRPNLSAMAASVASSGQNNSSVATELPPSQPQSSPDREPPATQPRSGSGLAGTWIFSTAGSRSVTRDQYAAEYIELQLTEREGILWGRYRARYKVPDRAISPEVQFFFEGSTAGDRHYSWRGEAGSAGEIHLRLLSETALSLNWFTSQLGHTLMLGSGSATLIRRRQE